MYAAYVVGTGADAYEVFNPDASVDFELPTKYEPELIDEIANMIGINVRDAIISNYASAEDTEA